MDNLNIINLCLDKGVHYKLAGGGRQTAKKTTADKQEDVRTIKAGTWL
jgi:hypothetical protein